MRMGIDAPGPAGPGAPPIRRLTLLAVALLLAGCGQQTGTAAANPSTPAQPSVDRAACAQLLGRLDQVSIVISASSELIANSADTAQLGQRIAAEAAQLRTAADLMARGPVPAALAKADQDLVAALRTFTDDFNRAGEAAKRGDLRAAVDAMRDEAAVQRIVAASQTIEDSCR